MDHAGWPAVKRERLVRAGDRQSSAVLRSKSCAVYPNYILLLMQVVYM